MTTTRLMAAIGLLGMSVTGCYPSIVFDRVVSTKVSGSQTLRVETAGDGFESGPIGRFSKRAAMRHVRSLASDIGVRVRTRPGETAAAGYIKSKLEKFGYDTHVQKFDVDGGTSRNVVARWPGAKRYGIVLGGHMDTVPESPGANDNASGVGVMLEIARRIAGKEQARFVTFVAFGSEEYGTNGAHHVGSQVFVNRLGDEGRKRLAGMISVDMIADGRPLITATAGIGPPIVARTLYRKMSAAGISTTYEVTCDCSDNGPFERAGIPAAFLWSGREPDYHSPSDTVANMKERDLLRTGRGVRAFIKDVDLGMVRRFRRR